MYDGNIDLHLQVLPEAFTICKVGSADELRQRAHWLFIAVTDREVSVVCPTATVPEATVAREDGWRAFRVAGKMDFSLTGVMAALSTTLAAHGISLFAVSTFDTDYILVKEDRLTAALDALRRAGHTVDAL